MLEPEYLEKFSDQLLALVDALSTAIIADMSKRLVKTGEITETSRRQAEILQGAGLLYKDVLKRVSQVSFTFHNVSINSNCRFSIFLIINSIYIP